MGIVADDVLVLNVAEVDVLVVDDEVDVCVEESSELVEV